MYENAPLSQFPAERDGAHAANLPRWRMASIASYAFTHSSIDVIYNSYISCCNTKKRCDQHAEPLEAKSVEESAMHGNRRIILVLAPLLALLLYGASSHSQGLPIEVPIIGGLLDGDSAPEERAAALEIAALQDVGTLLSSSSSATDPVLVEIAKTNADPAVRAEAIELFAEVGHEVEPTLQEQNVDVAGSELPREEHQRRLIALVADTFRSERDPQVLIAALEVLRAEEGAGLQDRIGEQRIVDLVTNGGSPELRVAALEIVVEFGSDASVARALTAARRDPVTWVSAYAGELQAVIDGGELGRIETKDPSEGSTGE
jgi:hypothetical protein